MKRLISALFLLPFGAFAAGSVTQSLDRLGSTDNFVLTVSWTGDASNGSIPSTPLLRNGVDIATTDGYYIYQVQTTPGSPSPTTLYDLVINDASSMDVMGGALANRSASAAEVAYPLGGFYPVSTNLTLVMTNQSVASAKGTVKIYFAKTVTNALSPTTVVQKDATTGDVAVAGKLTVAGTAQVGTTVLGADGTVTAGTGFVGDGSQLKNLPGSGTSNVTYTPDGLQSGGSVAWKGGLAFQVAPAAYQIGGVRYTSLDTALTLDAADGSNPRIDVIAVDANGTAVILKGTAAATPAKPAVDPATQIELTFAYVPTGGSAPSNYSVADIYHENTEWTSSVSANLNAASTSNPHAGTKDVEATNATGGNYVQFQAASPIDTAAYGNLVLYLRSKASWPKQRTLQLIWAATGTQKGSTVTLSDGSFGFSSATTSAYQTIVVPMALFNVAGVNVNQLKISVAGSGGTIGFYVDDITLQAGVSQPTGSSTLRGIGFVFDGGGTALTVGKTLYLRIPFACALTNWSIQSTTAETVTLKTWLVSGGTALPTVANVINTSGVSLATGTFVLSSLLTDFSTTQIPQDAQIAATLTAVTASQYVNFTLGCRQ